MPVNMATYVCPLSPATTVPGQPVFGNGVGHVGVILEVRNAQVYGSQRPRLECRVRWAGGTERWYPEGELHDYDHYLDIIEAEIVGLYQKRHVLERNFGIPHRPILAARP
jgi:hypothetical protein